MELSAAEGRVLGCLVEMEALAPEAVPVTLNALRLACNQVHGRDPVVAYDDRTVEDTLLSLKSRGLARFFPPTKDVRTTRYRHRADERWRMASTDLAVLAVLLLRGVQTVAEVRNQAQRLQPEMGPDDVDAVLDALAARTPRPFAARVGQPAGDRQPRWVEVLTAPPPVLSDDVARPAADGPGDGGGAARHHPVPAEVASPSYAELVARVADLEQRLAASLERRAPVAGDWVTPAYPPPPPPVEVRRATPPQLGAGDDDGWREVRRRSSGTPLEPSLSEVADRLGDIERRLARIEAELGALR
jgi:uncharacterized protein YceH (UPF0502 family)